MRGITLDDEKYDVHCSDGVQGLSLQTLMTTSHVTCIYMTAGFPSPYQIYMIHITLQR